MRAKRALAASRAKARAERKRLAGAKVAEREATEAKKQATVQFCEEQRERMKRMKPKPVPVTCDPMSDLPRPMVNAV